MLGISYIKQALGLGQVQGIFNEALDKQNWEQIRKDKFYADMLQEVYDNADRYLIEPTQSLPFSLYKIFDTSGSRKEYETKYFSHRGRLNTFAILTLVDGNEKYVSGLEDAIWAICDEYSWCIPAHFWGESLQIFDDKNIGKNAVWEGKASRAHDKFVDLFAAETGFALAEITYLVKDRLSPIVYHRARKLVKERILESFCQMNDLFWWETTTNNWAAVCAGSVGAAAIYLIEGNDSLAPIISRVLSAMDSFLSGYEEDGACTEGLGYWNYGFGFYTYFAELLRQRTNGEIDLFKEDKIKNIALFQQKCYLYENKTISFSDGSSQNDFKPGLTSYLLRRFEGITAPDVKFKSGYNSDSCYRWAASIRNFVWSNPLDYRNQTEKEAVYYLENAKWLISKKPFGSSLLALAAKAGHNDEPHNHNDVGHFIFHLNGESVFADLGAGEYTKQYFGPERYSYFCNGSQGHSVPIIDFEYQMAGRQYSSEVLQFLTTEDRDIFEMDISSAYGNVNLKSLVRKFDFDKIGYKLNLKDEYIFENQPESVVERFITFVEPELVAPGKLKLRTKNGSVYVSFDEDKLEYKVSKNEFMNHKAVKEDVYTVDLKVRDMLTQFSVEVVFEV